LSWLFRPYPHIEDGKSKLAISFFMGLVCFLFILIFQPFGISEIKESQSFYILLFGLNCTYALLITYFILPFIFSQFFKPAQWKVINEITFFLVVLLLISSFNYILNSVILKGISPHHSFIKFVGITCAVGVLPIVMMTYLTEKIANQKNEDSAKKINYHINTYDQSDDQTIIRLASDTVKSDQMEIILDDFIYAEADKNYSMVYYLQDDIVTKRLLRMSLKSLIAQADMSQILIRCHKSYLINKSKIINITGNARSLYIHLKDVESAIPVSRSFDQNLLKVASHSSQKAPV